MERFVLCILFFSIGCHGLVFFYSYLFLEDIPFRYELSVFILFLSFLSCSGAVVKSLGVFRIIQMGRMILLLIINHILNGHSLYVIILLVIPLLSDISAFERPSVSRITASLCLLIFLGDTFYIYLIYFHLPDMANLYQSESILLKFPIFYTALFLFISISTLLVFQAIISYREKLVDSGSVNSNLHEAFTNLVQANMDLQYYAAWAGSKGADDERMRITRELHDSVSYALTNVVMMMNAAGVLYSEEPDKVLKIVVDTKQLAMQCLQETRNTLYKIRALRNERPKGIKAIAQLIDSFRSATGVTIEFYPLNTPMSFGDTINSAIYRLVQEGLTNAFRHGKATFIRIQIRREDQMIYIRIRDNGKGITDTFNEGIGLSGMHERFDALGGKIDPHNVVDGFELSAVIPCQGKTVE